MAVTDKKVEDKRVTPDTFFTQTNCDRCGQNLNYVRTMSWFTTECLCTKCADEERLLRASLPNSGRGLEGCGYIPRVPLEPWR